MANQVATLFQPLNFSIRFSPLSSITSYNTAPGVCLFVRVVLTTQLSVLFIVSQILVDATRSNWEKNEHEILEFPLNHHLTPHEFLLWAKTIGGGPWPPGPMVATALAGHSSGLFLRVVVAYIIRKY